MAFVIIDGVIANDDFATPATPNTFVLQDGLEHSQFATGASATSQPVDVVLGLTTWVSAGGATSYADTLSKGIYTYTGKTVTDVYTRIDTLSKGTYSYLGKTVVDVYGHRDTLATGAYSYLGKSITDVIGSSGTSYADALSKGTYTYSGLTVVDSRAIGDVLATGSDSVIGKNLLDTFARNDSQATGTYTLTGYDITDVKTGAIAYADSLSVGAYSLTGISLTDSYVANVVVTTSGAGRFRRQLIVVEIDGKEYSIFADELEAFLASMKEEAKDEPVKVDRKTKKVKKVKKAIVRLPEIKIISAPVSIIPQLQAQIERTNVVLYNIMSKAMQRYSDDIEDEELILMML